VVYRQNAGRTQDWLLPVAMREDAQFIFASQSDATTQSNAQMDKWLWSLAKTVQGVLFGSVKNKIPLAMSHQYALMD
jgi:hypothetical protein